MAIPQHELRFVITFHITTFTPNRPKARGPRITTKAQSELGKTGRRLTSRAAGRGQRVLPIIDTKPNNMSICENEAEAEN